jgi:hypothetical protein
MPENALPFVVGESYTRDDIYRIMKVPEDKQGGIWHTGYTRWHDDLFIFATVGAPATGGFDYPNAWEGDTILRWSAKNGSTLQQSLIQWMLREADRVFVFTRKKPRIPFAFEGLGSPASWEDRSPVVIRWNIRSPGDGFEILPTEVAAPSKYLEGAARTVFVNAYERNASAKSACLKHFGFDCVVCGFNFSRVYGEIGEDFIHVHHLRDLATIGVEYEVDPLVDLRPVCPNCHAMLHRKGTPAMSIEELKSRIKA